MGRPLRIFMFLTALLPLHAHAGGESHAPQGYKLVWTDEFDETGLPDPDRWVFDTEANATGWYNEELQYYAVGRPETTWISDGVLTITARKERLTTASDYGGQDYSSARLITRGKAEWTYAHFEMRAKLPCGKGTWPAFWTLGPSTIPWPDTGEIDIMEHVGAQPGVIASTIHTKASEGTWGIGGRMRVPHACERFHTYHATWTEDKIVTGVDGVNFFTYPNTNDDDGSWPFDKPRYLLVNLAIGGEAAGEVDDTIFPVTYVIDFVRVYQKQSE